MGLVFDQGAALAVGLPVLPKTAYIAEYSERITHRDNLRFRNKWIKKLRQADVLGEAIGKKRQVPLRDHGSGPHDGPEFFGGDVQLKAPPAQALPLGRQDGVQPDIGRRQAVAKLVQSRRCRHLIGLQ